MKKLLTSLTLIAVTACTTEAEALSPVCYTLPAEANAYALNLPIRMDRITTVSSVNADAGQCSISFRYKLDIKAANYTHAQIKVFSEALSTTNINRFCTGISPTIVKWQKAGVTIHHHYNDEAGNLVSYHKVNTKEC